MMQLTQSAVYFPERRLEDWYTLTNERLGEGGFATVELGYDDREFLLYLRYLSEHAEYEIQNLKSMPEDIQHAYWQDYWDSAGWPEVLTLLSESPSNEVISKHVTSWQQLAYYLSAFNTQSLRSFFNISYDYGVKSRLELILMVTRHYARNRQNLLIGRDEMCEQLFAGRVSRPLVAIKIMTAVTEDQEVKFENAAKTEVFGLGRVSSETSMMLTALNQTIQRSPVGCATMKFDLPEGPDSPYGPYGPDKKSVTVPIINCLEDYFYTPGSKSFGYEPQAYYLVLSFTEGKTLYSLLKKLRNPTNLHSVFRVPVPFPGHFIWYVAWVMAHALKRSHDDGHIIHNDVKLENIMYDKDLGGVILIDYGLSCHLKIGTSQVRKIDKCDAVGGTPSYGSLEMFKFGFRYPGSDIWALGVTLWEMAMGNPYYPGTTAIEMRDNIISGARPNVNQILNDIPHYNEFIGMLSQMFQLEVQNRPTAIEMIDYMTNVFTDDIDINLEGEEQKQEVGAYLYHHGNWELEDLLERQRNRRREHELKSKFSIVFGGNQSSPPAKTTTWNVPLAEPATEHEYSTTKQAKRHHRTSLYQDDDDEGVLFGFQTPPPKSKRQRHQDQDEANK